MITTPIILTIFGITGDLARRKLIPAIQLLLQQHPETLLTVVGYGRRAFTNETFRDFLRKEVEEPVTEPFLARCFYHQGSFDDSKDFHHLATTLSSLAAPTAQRLFYFAVAPEFYAPLAHELAQAGLLKGTPAPRLLIEKPFGHDLASAEALDGILHRVLAEDQIYRVDHYLTKEIVTLIPQWQHDPVFSPLWDRSAFDHIQITLAEAIGVERRGAYYDQTGALKDMLQSHGLLLASLLTLESAPQTHDIRQTRAHAIHTFQPATCVTGRYAGYTQEPTIQPDSSTETYGAVKIIATNSTGISTPLYIRTGKQLTRKISRLSLHYKKQGMHYQSQPVAYLEIRIDPEPACIVHFAGTIAPLTLWRQDPQPHQDYARVIQSAIEGIQTAFVHHDESIAAWQLLASMTLPPPITYDQGSEGPAMAEQLIAQDGRTWIPLTS